MHSRWCCSRKGEGAVIPLYNTPDFLISCVWNDIEYGVAGARCRREGGGAGPARAARSDARSCSHCLCLYRQKLTMSSERTVRPRESPEVHFEDTEKSILKALLTLRAVGARCKREGGGAEPAPAARSGARSWSRLLVLAAIYSQKLTISSKRIFD